MWSHQYHTAHTDCCKCHYTGGKPPPKIPPFHRNTHSFAGVTSTPGPRNTLPVSYASTVTLAVLLGHCSFNLTSVSAPRPPPPFFPFLSTVVVAQLLYFFHLQHSIAHVFTKGSIQSGHLKKVYYISESANSIYFKQSHIIFFSSFI